MKIFNILNNLIKVYSTIRLIYTWNLCYLPVLHCEHNSWLSSIPCFYMNTKWVKSLLLDHSSNTLHPLYFNIKIYWRQWAVEKSVHVTAQHIANENCYQHLCFQFRIPQIFNMTGIYSQSRMLLRKRNGINLTGIILMVLNTTEIL